MSAPPELMTWDGSDWQGYEDEIYTVYLKTVAHAKLRFRGEPVKVQFRPESKQKGYGFWHLISEAPDQSNRNEDDRVPDLRRCERVRWVAWCIENANEPEFSWWENERWNQPHVVIWAEAHDYAVILAKRITEEGFSFYLLKTAYCLRSHNIRKFTKERDAWRKAQKD